jgi:hypothetical protein
MRRLPKGGLVMKKRGLIGILFLLLGVGMFAKLLLSADVPKMTKDELKAMLGNPDLVMVDVRLGKDWTDSEMKIKGAVREDPRDVESWAKKYTKDKILVLYCA